MSDFVDCPDCGYSILDKLGTICPNCGYTVGYFNGEKRRKEYGRLFFLTVFAPFISFVTILFAQLNIVSFIISIFIALFLAIKSCPIKFKDIFSSKFEKWFFWSIWIFLNTFILVLVVNILSKL